MIDAAMSERRMRVVVCGTTFGQVYLNAFRDAGLPFELAGIVARGSVRSRECAERWGVPLFTEALQVPGDTDIACVVVRSGALGGRGTELATTLMRRGIHVLQEHPVHHDDLAACLTQAHRHRVVYRLNSFYPHLEPVRRFLAAARRLISRQRPLFVDAACAIHVAYPLFDILGQALGGVRPWSVNALLPATESPPPPDEGGAPFRSLEGLIGGVPLTLRVQNQIALGDPDNHLHLLHRITIGTEGGNLTLVDTHGPLLWSPRLHIPAEMKDHFDLAAADSAEHLDFASSAPLGPPSGPTFREILGSMWPAGVAAALLELRTAILNGEDPRPKGQYHLALCRIWQETTSRLGYPELIRFPDPRPLAIADLAPGFAPNWKMDT